MNYSRLPAVCPLLIQRPLRRFVLSFMILLSSLLALAHVSPAQTEVASVSGTIVDRSGGLVPSVQVTVINTDTNEKYETKTNNAGVYSVPSVKPGHYRILVTKSGFKQIDLRNITLNVQDSVNRNFTLDLGGVSETVIVNAGDSLNINTTDASVSTVVDQTYVKNMPLNGRSFQDLILLTPGVVTQSPQTGGTLGKSGEFSVNGQRPESNYYTVDGVSGNVGTTAGFAMLSGAGPSGSLGASTAVGTTQALVSVDALQEFRVQSSTYSAEYGRNPGGQFAFETKSGTNQWHGTAYDYLRNDLFDANDWFNNYFGKNGAALRQNDFGGTLGAPIRIPGLYNGKDRTFFFVSYEGLRLVAPQPAALSFVPDAALRSSAPAALQPVLNAFPVQSPNGIDDTANGIAQFIGTWSNPSSIDSTSVRFDHVVNDKLRLFFRFSDTASRSATRGVGGNDAIDLISAYTLRTYTAGASSMLTSSLSNELRLNFSLNAVTGRSIIDQLGGSTPVDLGQLTGLGPGAGIIPVLAYGGHFIFLQQRGESGAQKQWNLLDTDSLSLGRHQLKFGVDYRRLMPFASPNNPSLLYFYTSKNAVLNNSAFTVLSVQAPAYPLYTNFSTFIQDAWRVSNRLSLSFGLRWDVNPAPSASQGLMPYTIQGSGPDTWALAPQGTPLWQTTWYNFAPRLGGAYVLRSVPGRETVVRAGGGVFFDTGQQLGSQGFNEPGFVAGGRFMSGGSFPIVPAIPSIVNPPVPPFPSLFGFPRHLQLPYTLQWNASVEQALGKSQALTVSYVGSHAARLLKLVDFFPANNPNSSFFEFVENGLTSDYNSVQIQFRRRLSRGLTALASYTWSHCIDYGSQNYNYPYQRGSCDFDVRNNLSAGFSYDLPNVGNHGLVDAVLHHWGVDDRFTARTGFPVTLVGNDLLRPDGQLSHAGLDLVPNQPVYLYGGNCATVLQGLNHLKPGQGCPGGRAINPNAFVQVPVDPNTGNATRQGNAPRNFARGFGAWQMDLAVRRDFPIHERLKLQFRAEAFNVFNHPNFGLIDPNCGGTPGVPGCTNPTFGQATQTLANSLGILSPLYQMGGPRSMQLALKLVF